MLRTVGYFLPLLEIRVALVKVKKKKKIQHYAKKMHGGVDAYTHVFLATDLLQKRRVLNKRQDG
jgi:hypothetical protein